MAVSTPVICKDTFKISETPTPTIPRSPKTSPAWPILMKISEASISPRAATLCKMSLTLWSKTQLSTTTLPSLNWLRLTKTLLCTPKLPTFRIIMKTKTFSTAGSKAQDSLPLFPLLPTTSTPTKLATMDSRLTLLIETFMSQLLSQWLITELRTTFTAILRRVKDKFTTFLLFNKTKICTLLNSSRFPKMKFLKEMFRLVTNSLPIPILTEMFKLTLPTMTMTLLTLFHMKSMPMATEWKSEGTNREDTLTNTKPLSPTKRRPITSNPPLIKLMSWETLKTEHTPQKIRLGIHTETQQKSTTTQVTETWVSLLNMWKVTKKLLCLARIRLSPTFPTGMETTNNGTAATKGDTRLTPRLLPRTKWCMKPETEWIVNFMKI